MLNDDTHVSEPVDEPTSEGKEDGADLQPEGHQPSSAGSEEAEPKLPNETPEEDPEQPVEPEESEETLQSFLEEPEDVTYKKVKRHPELAEGDISKDGDEYVVHSEHVANDIDKMFGDTPKPKLFFSIYKNTPKKADAIAKACGWRTRHYMKDAIEDFIEAKTDDARQEILESDFPEWTWSSDAERPYKVDLAGGGKETVQTSGRMPWSKDDIGRAINDYAADNDSISKESILKSAKVAKLLEEFSAFQKNGQPISASEALSLAIPLAGLEKKTVSKAKKVSAGGGRTKSKTETKSGITPGMEFLAAQAGVKL